MRRFRTTSLPAHIIISEPRAAARWAIVRRSGLWAVPVLLVWLVVEPSSALNVFWYVIIPILPAIFFLNPALWRNVCPLATLNELGNRLGQPRMLSPQMTRVLSLGGLALFHLLVPARHFAFNRSGAALAITVLAVGGLAVVLGAVFSVRSAFCNTFCPILPIELLYGVAPLVPVKRSRCTTCTVCTPRGCFDLAERKAVLQRLGPARRTARWVTTPYGVFFAALPGFIIGYNQVADGPVSTAVVVYGTTLGWSLASTIVIAGLVEALRLDSQRTLPFIAAAAGGTYYWYAGPATVMQLAGPAWAAAGIRILGIGIVAVWLVRALVSVGAWRRRSSATDDSMVT